MCAILASQTLLYPIAPPVFVVVFHGGAAHARLCVPHCDASLNLHSIPSTLPLLCHLTPLSSWDLYILPSCPFQHISLHPQVVVANYRKQSWV